MSLIKFCLKNEDKANEREIEIEFEELEIQEEEYDIKMNLVCF
ncbi:hypothetical protein ACIGC1_27320 [Peribacillus butanolivorans]